MNYALITGASKGIGRSLAFALAKKKINLLLVARSEALLKELSVSVKKQYSVEADYLSIDLSHQDSPKILHQWCIDKGYSVNILINNAGYGLWGEFDKLGLEEQNNMMQLNMFSLINLTYEMLPLL